MSTALRCNNHPSVESSYTCFVCRSPLCEACIRTRDDGAIVCANCLDPEPLEPLAPAPVEELPLSPPPPMPPPLPPGAAVYCRVHPDMPAIARCRDCGAAVCATCDFCFPGNVHLCPTCATNPKQSLSPKRKKLMGWSIGLGVASFLGSAGLIAAFAAMVRAAGHRDEETTQALGCVGELILAAAVTGLILGLCAYRRTARNPLYLLVGPILNGLVTVLWLLCIIIGLSRAR